MLRTNAAAGKAWAQCSLAAGYDNGGVGIGVDKRKAESLYRKAADQGHSHAQYQLGLFEFERNNASEACRLFEAAASQGHMSALGQMGKLYRDGRGVEQDFVKAARLLTISAKLQSTELHVHAMLGRFFFNGTGGLHQSMIRSMYYLKPAIEGVESCAATMKLYASILFILSVRAYPDCLIAPSGHNVKPEVLFWYRRANAKFTSAGSIQAVESYESTIKELCGCCFRTLSTDKPKCCIECRAVYYCSRECQAADWKAGHKKDCVKSLKKLLRAKGKFNNV